MSCPPKSDNNFGPRVNTLCRPFDFTLLFEDALFTILPASFFLIAVAARLMVLFRAPVKVTSYRLATWKLVCRSNIGLGLQRLNCEFDKLRRIDHSRITSSPAPMLSRFSSSGASFKHSSGCGR